MEYIQVFEWLKMPHPLDEQFLDWAETNNDSYVRWYYKGMGGRMEDTLVDAIDKWLLEQGLVPEEGPYFHVLIHVSW